MNFKRYWHKLKGVLGLSFQLAKAEFKLRNEGSYLGIFWYLLNPILTFILLFFIFNDRLGSGVPNYSLYLLLGIIMFNFFQNTTVESTRSIIKDHHFLIKSIDFPRESLVFSIVLKNLFSHMFEVLLFLIIAVFSINIFSALYYFPILILFIFFIFGFSLFLSSLTVYFVDLDNIWNFAIRIAWLATPIFYSIAGQTRLFYLNLFNPVYYFIAVSRDLIIYNKMPEKWLLFGAIFISAGFLILGLLLFSRLKIKFAEMI